MRIVSSVDVKLIDYTRDCARLVAAAAAMTVLGKPADELRERLNNVAVDNWIRLIVTHGYTSVLEHCKYTFEVVCSRACSHQLVRHRIASYTQHSMRRNEGFLLDATLELCKITGEDCSTSSTSKDDFYVYSRVAGEIADMVEFDEKLFDKVVYAMSRGFVYPPSANESQVYEMTVAYLRALSSYWWLRYLGAKPEDARLVLPHSVKTRILVTMNARELLDVFLPLRLCKRAQWEIREVAKLMLRELLRVEPLLWRWAGPRCLRVAQLAGAECTLDDMLKGKCKLPIERCPEGIKREKVFECMVVIANEVLETNDINTK